MYQYYRGYSPSYGPRTPQPPKKKKSRRRLVLAGLFVSAFVVTVVFKTLSPAPDSKVHGAALVKTAAHAPIPSVNQTALAAQVNQAINDNPGLEIGVSIIDTTSNQRYDYGLGNTQYIAASTTKLLSASLFLHDVEAGQASLNQSLGGATAQAEMQRMIVISDDAAWEEFNDLLGHPALEQYAHSLGMNSYDPDDNQITPDDLSLLLAQLYQGKLLNHQHTQLLLSYMAQADYKQYIGGVIPSGVKFYHKIGFLQDRFMDAAIIDNGKRPYVLVIFTKDPSGTYNQTVGLQAFHEITTATLNVFGQ